MRATRVLATLAIVVGALGVVGPAEARDAQGAFIHQTNDPDPTVAPHRHRMKVRTPMTFTDSRVEVQKCRTCDLVVETETPLDGSKPPRTRRYYPVR